MVEGGRRGEEEMNSRGEFQHGGLEECLIKLSAALLTLVLYELVQEAGLPCPSTTNHQELKQEV